MVLFVEFGAVDESLSSMEVHFEVYDFIMIVGVWVWCSKE